MRQVPTRQTSSASLGKFGQSFEVTKMYLQTFRENNFIFYFEMILYYNIKSGSNDKRSIIFHKSENSE